MTPLRQKLIDEIQLRGFSIHTQDSYVRSVAGLARFYRRAPDHISDDEVKSYLLHLLREKKLGVSSLIVAVSGLRFFFGKVLHRPTTAIEQALPRMKKPILRPKVYSVQELERLFKCPTLSRKHRGSASIKAKERRIGIPCFPRDCSRSCAAIGAFTDPRNGCFPVGFIPIAISPRAPYKEPSLTRWCWRDCPSVAEYIRCGTVSPRICWMPTW